MKMEIVLTDAQGEFLESLDPWHKNRAIQKCINQCMQPPDQSLRDVLEEFMNEDPYPEDIFLPITKGELKDIHELLQREMDMPLDRLTGHIGRILRNGIKESFKAKSLLAANQKQDDYEKMQIEWEEKNGPIPDYPQPTDREELTPEQVNDYSNPDKLEGYINGKIEGLKEHIDRDREIEDFAKFSFRYASPTQIAAIIKEFRQSQNKTP